MTLSQGQLGSSDYNDKPMTAFVPPKSRTEQRTLLAVSLLALVSAWSFSARAQSDATALGSVPAAAAAPDPVAPAASQTADQTAASSPNLPPPYPTTEPLPPATDDPLPAEVMAPPEMDEPPGGAGQPGANPADPSIYEPPLPEAYIHRRDTAEPSVPPPPPQHVAPRSSFWIGLRSGLMIPLGSAWLDGEPVGDLCCVESSRPLSEFARPGPSVGVEAGVRFGRHYQGFAFLEHASLNSGRLDGAFGRQSGTTSSVFGGGFRFNTHPDAIGMVVEVGLGYRRFEANWRNGTKLTAADDLFSTQLGFGVAWRVDPMLSAEFLMRVGGGSFTGIEWKFADGTKEAALSRYDRNGQYIPFGFHLALHWDLVRSDD
jgi:hypothetical protein